MTNSTNVTSIVIPDPVLDTDVDWVYWIGVLLGLGLTIAPIVFALNNKLDKKKERHAIFSAAACLVTGFMYLTLLIDQGMKTRDDDVSVLWARWAFQIAVLPIFGVLIGSALKMHKTTRLVLGIMSAAVATGLLFSCLSTGDRIYIWLSMAAAVYALQVVLLILYPKLASKTTPPQSFAALKAIAGIHLGLYFLVFGLGHSAGSIINLLTESILYLILDLGRLVVCCLVMAQVFKSIDYVKVEELKSANSALPMTHTGELRYD